MRPSATTRGVRAGERAVDDPVRSDDAGEEQLGDDLDDPRAADAGDAGLGGRLGEARLVRPQLAADHPEARLERGAVDPDALDRARRGALAGARSGRPRRPGRSGSTPRAAASRLPSTISALVPTSTSSATTSRLDAAPRRGSRRRCRRRRGRRCTAARRPARRDGRAGPSSRPRSSNGPVGGERERRRPERDRVDARARGDA